ncbi:hypothetical protein, partial [Pseudomonas syringae group genomosp. 7]|uniref:hypothetical protein n=1 Tax=Pseudomonas syringae group genomosp. 7 TaxID=251699 RepID=UPI00376F6FA5
MAWCCVGWLCCGGCEFCLWVVVWGWGFLLCLLVWCVFCVLWCCFGVWGFVLGLFVLWGVGGCGWFLLFGVGFFFVGGVLVLWFCGFVWGVGCCCCGVGWGGCGRLGVGCGLCGCWGGGCGVWGGGGCWCGGGGWVCFRVG